LMDHRHHNFKAIQATGVADPDGDKAFDADEFPSASPTSIPEIQVVRL